MLHSLVRTGGVTKLGYPSGIRISKPIILQLRPCALCNLALSPAAAVFASQFSCHPSNPERRSHHSECAHTYSQIPPRAATPHTTQSPEKNPLACTAHEKPHQCPADSPPARRGPASAASRLPERERRCTRLRSRPGHGQRVRWRAGKSKRKRPHGPRLTSRGVASLESLQS